MLIKTFGGKIVENLETENFLKGKEENLCSTNTIWFSFRNKIHNNYVR